MTGAIGLAAFGVIIGGWSAYTCWAAFAMWQERRRGLHLHPVTGVLHSHMHGHRPHAHPLSATVSGWRRVHASVIDAEMTHVDALDIHEPIPPGGLGAGDPPWWDPRIQ